MLLWLLSLIVGTDTGSCIDPWGACTNAGVRMDPDG